MSNEKDLRSLVLIAGGKGDLELDEANSMLSILFGVPMIQSTSSESKRVLNKEGIYQTLDVNGDLLIAGENYTLQDKKVKILRERHGAGNIADVYMRVYYLDSSLEETFEVVNGKFPNGIFEGAVYNSKFEPIKKD